MSSNAARHIVFPSFLLAAFLTAICAHSAQPAAAAPTEPRALADSIAPQVAEIRGLPFKQPVNVEIQSTADFDSYVHRRIDEAVAPSVKQHYGKIVRTLGLYRGPAIEDFSAMMSTVMSSQVAAYYDPDRQSFFVVKSGMPDMMMGVLYSHELYHALQDQHFGLAQYMEMGTAHDSRAHSADAMLARQAVVEGEATYMMTLWLMQKMAGKIPPRDALAPMISMQANLSMDQLRAALAKPEVSEAVGADMRDAIASSDDIPPFIMESMLGVYFKGLAFVFAVQEQGWSAVEKLYSEYPPQSTEHILHPEKWLAREAPASFEWPDFDKVKVLRGWQLLESDVLGEFQWRIVFKEHGLAAEAEPVAAGWDGDRYAVFKNKDSDSTLLLMRTSWDSEADAREFLEAYRRLLAVKYADAAVATRVEQKGNDVFIVEGADEANIDSLLKLVRQTKARRAL